MGAVQTAVSEERAAWLAARQTGIGASESPAVLGLSPWKSPLAVYAEKVGAVEQRDLAAESEAVEWGVRLEAVVADAYAEKTGRKIGNPGRYTIQRHPAVPFVICTLDRTVVSEDRGDGQPGVLEVKTAGIQKSDDWAEEPPIHYQIQLQHQMAVMGSTWGSIACLVGGQKFVWFDMERNDRFIDFLLGKLSEFWERVKRQDPPPPRQGESVASVLQALYPQDNEEVIELPSEAILWDENLRAAQALAKETEKQIDHYKSLIKAALKENTSGYLPDGSVYRWKKVAKAGYVVQPTEYRELRRLAPKSK